MFTVESVDTTVYRSDSVILLALLLSNYDFTSGSINEF